MQLANPLNQIAPVGTDGAGSKVAYTAPVITEYGSIRALTRSKGMNGMTDGANAFVCFFTGRCRTNA